MGIIKNYLNQTYAEKTVFKTSIVSIFNFLWSIAKLLFGIISKSYFIFASGIFTLLIGFSKRLCVHGIKKEKFSSEKKIVIYTCLGLICACMFYGIYMFRLYFVNYQPKYGLIGGITIASFSFVNLTFAIIGITKVRKNSYMHKMLKITNFITALTDLVITQIALLYAIEPVTDMTYNIHFGLGIALIGILINIFMIIRVSKKL